MSKSLKGWMSKHTLANNASGYVYTGCRIPSCKPVLIQPIDDESLPHPGDGRIWETAGGIPVTVIGVDDGHVWLRLANGARSTLPVGCLRERKPEPEHNARCQRYRDHYGRKDCICEERRSGEDRREGERRKEWPYWVSLADRRHEYGGDLVKAKRGRRSGEDRRKS